MAVILLQLIAPMQSWGTNSRFTLRETDREPSKSAVLGLIASALGLERDDWEGLEPLTHLRMAVRHDRPGLIMRDFHTAGCHALEKVVTAEGSSSRDGIVSNRYYLSDAAFLVGLESLDIDLLKTVVAALRNPVWPLFLGRKSFVPSESIWIPDGLQEGSLIEVMSAWPWLGGAQTKVSHPDRLLVSLESETIGEGTLRMDLPISSFAERRFGSRYVVSEIIECPAEVANVSE